jgi:hypothetical protein
MLLNNAGIVHPVDVVDVYLRLLIGYPRSYLRAVGFENILHLLLALQIRWWALLRL